MFVSRFGDRSTFPSITVFWGGLEKQEVTELHLLLRKQTNTQKNNSSTNLSVCEHQQENNPESPFLLLLFDLSPELYSILKTDISIVCFFQFSFVFYSEIFFWTMWLFPTQTKSFSSKSLFCFPDNLPQWSHCYKNKTESCDSIT